MPARVDRPGRGREQLSEALQGGAEVGGAHAPEHGRERIGGRARVIGVSVRVGGAEAERRSKEAGGAPWKVVPPKILPRRRRIYFAVASVVTVLALALVIWMFTFEDTAIIMEPAATRGVFVPLATPYP